MIDGARVTGRAVVIGAGTMGGGIAAQLANAGWHVRLLDVPAADFTARSATAAAGIENLTKRRPPLLFLPEYADRIKPGNTADDLDSLMDADWIVEAIVENMPAKQALLATICSHASSGAVVTSNTSGLNLAGMSEHLPASFKARFFGTHFLNPPRYLKLLEVVPTAAADSRIVAGFIQFAEQVLGRRVVAVRDSPGFVSTRIWIEHLLQTIRLAEQHRLSVEEVDLLTGPLIGRPKSGTFRMADIVGLDIIAAIASNQQAALPDDPFREHLFPPSILAMLSGSARLGEKSGAGFYKRSGRDILSCDLATGDYRERLEPDFAAVKALMKLPVTERIAAVTADSGSREGAFVNALLNSLHEYVCYAGPLVAPDVVSVDSVMRWGFQWELGPFEIEDLRHKSADYYETCGSERRCLYFADRRMKTVTEPAEYMTVAGMKAQGRTILETPVGSLVDMGGGVGCIEMRTKMNTFGPELCDFFDAARERAEFELLGLVIGSDAPYFSAGFNLKLFLDAAPREDWAAIDAMLARVQQTFMNLKYSPIPSVAAVRGYTLGGGCECAFACSAIQAAPELIMGLPELPAGLIPSGGAFKELLHRTFEGWDGKTDAFTRADRAVDYIVAHSPSTSAAHAAKLGLLRSGDSISRNADRLLFDAKQKVLALANSGYTPPVKRGVWAVGAEGLARMRFAIHQHAAAIRRITEHDRLIADRAVYVMCGGPLSSPQEVPEEYMLNLERQVFLTLVREPKSLERIKYLLETGKPLQN